MIRVLNLEPYRLLLCATYCISSKTRLCSLPFITVTLTARRVIQIVNAPTPITYSATKTPRYLILPSRRAFIASSTPWVFKGHFMMAGLIPCCSAKSSIFRISARGAPAEPWMLMPLTKSGNIGTGDGSKLTVRLYILPADAVSSMIL